MKIRVPAWSASVSAGAVLIALLTPAAVPAQSLGELAKQEEARRKTVRTPGKVYTNETIRSDPRAPTPATTPAAAAEAPSPGSAVQPTPSGQAPPAGQAKPAGDATAAPPAAAPPDLKQDEAAWRKRVQNERELLQRAQTFAEALQSRINALSTDFVNRDDPVQRNQIANDRQKALAELDRVRQEIQQHTKAITAIQEEARKTGVPPGWVR